MQAQSKTVAFDLPARKCLGERVGCHIVRGTIYDVDGGTCNDLADEVIANVDVLRPRVVVVVHCKLECHLVVAI